MRDKFKFSDRRYCTHGRIFFDTLFCKARVSFDALKESFRWLFRPLLKCQAIGKPVRRSTDNGWEAEKTHDYGNGVAERVYVKMGSIEQ